MPPPFDVRTAVVVAAAAVVLSGCASDSPAAQLSSASPASPSASPTPACDPDAAFLVGAIRRYSIDKAWLRRHRSGLAPGPFRIFAARVRRLLDDVAHHDVPTSLFRARDAELMAFNQIIQGAERAETGEPADAAEGTKEIAAGEGQLGQVGAALADAVTACR
jgi:hypothetical protein